MLEFIDLMIEFVILFFTDIKTFLISTGIILTVILAFWWVWADIDAPPTH